eukprot:TRINITY_DN33064_c0_g1_i1.p1 TRINITY_DN33064_c0_g1~~TRINITY_DN33064_c0_g1_i1.p1  ORF type:complete len:580 (-),score=67.68 TRINITY_DN33064_c0_g1_i1:16-1755(-)
MSGPWGRAIDSTWKNVPLVKSVDTLGCVQPGTANYTGKWVLIWRGTCQFGEKAKNAQDKGAAGVIIINNVPGADPIGMAAGTAGGAVTIPVLMVSNPEGAAMWNTLATTPLTISLCVWGLGNANDLAIVPKSGALTMGATPLNQISGSSATAYKQYTGALLANVGTANQTNIKLKSVITFTPTGGSASVVFQDSVTTASFDTIDSIISITSPNVGTLNPTTTGMYTTTYTVSAALPDDNTADNSVTYNTYITPNMYCKGRTDAAGNPTITNGLRFGSGTSSFIWGPLFYVNKGGYRAQSLRYAINDNDTSKHSLDQITVADKNTISYLLKWVDGSNGGTTDNIIQATEVEIKGASIYTFTSADSNNRLFTSIMGDKDGKAGIVTLDANSWYWIVVDMPGPTFLSSDDAYSYFTRSFAADRLTTSVNDWSTPYFVGSLSTFTDNGSQNANMLLGASTAASANVDSVYFPNSDGVPAVALELSPFQVSVNEVANQGMKEFSVYPNPATTSVNVKLNLSEKSDKVEIRIIDAVGRRIITEDYNNLQKETLNISTEKLAAGNYYVVLIANGSATVQPFVVTKQ